MEKIIEIIQSMSLDELLDLYKKAEETAERRLMSLIITMEIETRIEQH